ncbi:MAG TPA: serine protease [Pseudomonadales bacterium]|nr:serine protease [Pseudomonadales bacterium]
MRIRNLVLAACLVALSTFIPSTAASDVVQKDQYELSKVASFSSTEGLTDLEKNIRRAAVKVRTLDGGHGSGSYVLINGFHIVITAHHVADGPIGSVYTIVPGKGKKVEGRLVWSDSDNDVATILVPRIKSRRPMPFKPLSEAAAVGTAVAYSGYPASFSLLSFRGMIVGHEDVGVGNSLVLHSYGWFGCSGSGIYDLHGRFVGVLWGVSIGGNLWSSQVQEDLTFLTPAHKISKKTIVKAICSAKPCPQRCLDM